MWHKNVIKSKKNDARRFFGSSRRTTHNDDLKAAKQRIAAPLLGPLTEDFFFVKAAFLGAFSADFAADQFTPKGGLEYSAIAII